MFSHFKTGPFPCPLRSNEYIEELGKLEGVKDNMVGGGLPVELAVELLRWAPLFCVPFS